MFIGVHVVLDLSVFLSRLLFALYLDGLLSDLVESGVGCYWGNMFAGFCVMQMTLFYLLHTSLL